MSIINNKYSNLINQIIENKLKGNNSIIPSLFEELKTLYGVYVDNSRYLMDVPKCRKDEFKATINQHIENDECLLKGMQNNLKIYKNDLENLNSEKIYTTTDSNRNTEKKSVKEKIIHDEEQKIFEINCRIKRMKKLFDDYENHENMIKNLPKEEKALHLEEEVLNKCIIKYDKNLEEFIRLPYSTIKYIHMGRIMEGVKEYSIPEPELRKFFQEKDLVMEYIGNIVKYIELFEHYRSLYQKYRYSGAFPEKDADEILNFINS